MKLIVYDVRVLFDLFFYTWTVPPLPPLHPTRTSTPIQESFNSFLTVTRLTPLKNQSTQDIPAEKLELAEQQQLISSENKHLLEQYWETPYFDRLPMGIRLRKLMAKNAVTIMRAKFRQQRTPFEKAVLKTYKTLLTPQKHPKPHRYQQLCQGMFCKKQKCNSPACIYKCALEIGIEEILEQLDKHRPIETYPLCLL